MSLTGNTPCEGVPWELRVLGVFLTLRREAAFPGPAARGSQTWRRDLLALLAGAALPWLPTWEPSSLCFSTRAAGARAAASLPYLREFGSLPFGSAFKRQLLLKRADRVLHRQSGGPFVGVAESQRTGEPF